MFPNATVSSRSSSSRSGGNSCSRNSSMPSLRMRSPLSPKTSFNPLFRHSDAFTSFDASNFAFYEQQRKERKIPILRRYNSHDSHVPVEDDLMEMTRNHGKNRIEIGKLNQEIRVQQNEFFRTHTESSRSTQDSSRNSRDSSKNSQDSWNFKESSRNSKEPKDLFKSNQDSSNKYQKDHSTRSNRTSSTPNDSPQSTGDRKILEFEARDFLERYSLPRVVRVADGEPLLLYRCFDNFAKVEARSICKKGKEKSSNVLHFPEGYNGWFSLTNEKGERCAVQHSSILQLVREQVCSFISILPFTAYTGQNAELSDLPGKVQYLKTTVRAGQLFQLRAVFQHRPESAGNSTKSSKLTSRGSRDKDLANRYAQLISQNNQELYVPLTTKGEFYEVHSSIKARLCFPGLLDKTGPLALDKDCLYKITHLLRRVALPIKVKLMSGPLPPGLPKDFTDMFILERKFTEPLMVTCTLPSPSEAKKHEISCISLNSNVKLSKCMLGFDSENRLFKSQRLQAALSFCHKNVENWYREVRLAANLQETPSKPHDNQIKVNENCLNCLQSPTGACPGCYIREDSEQKQIITREVMEKFPKSKKWYKNIKILSGNEVPKQVPFEIEGQDKVKSIDRYKDMSKLIEEKFGKKTYNPVKKSASFMFSTKRIDLEDTQKGNPALLKCQSLDNQLYEEAKIKKEEKSHLKRRQLSGDTKIEVRSSKSNISDLSYDFQMCILNNENTKVESKEKVLRINFDEIKPSEDIKPLKKTKPDLIPTLTKDNSFITDRLCSEFHVKTKVQKKSSKKTYDEEKPLIKSVKVQVHEVQKKFTTTLQVDDIPYSNVADEIRGQKSGKKSPDENIYAEICETACKCDNSNRCECKRTKKQTADYCYVKLGSNGDSVTSDSDEAIYNTLS